MEKGPKHKYLKVAGDAATTLGLTGAFILYFFQQMIAENMMIERIWAGSSLALIAFGTYMLNRYQKNNI